MNSGPKSATLWGVLRHTETALDNNGDSVVDTTTIAAEGKDSNPRTDRFGDPLPDGAVARLGTVRWRYPRPAELVPFIENGKQLLVCCGDGLIRISDAATGKDTWMSTARSATALLRWISSAPSESTACRPVSKCFFF